MLATMMDVSLSLNDRKILKTQAARIVSTLNFK